LRKRCPLYIMEFSGFSVRTKNGFRVSTAGGESD
jgi:hypothetical protein